MHRMPKLVHRPHLPELVPSVCQNPEVPCECRRVTADIYDSLRPDLQNRFQTLRIASLARRIHTDHIYIRIFFCCLSRLDIGGQYFFRFTYKELCIFDSTFFALRAMNSEIVPTPQYRSHTVSFPVRCA